MKNNLLAKLLVLGLFVFIVSFATAGPIPSTASGTYRGSGNTAGWDCEIRAFQLTGSLGETYRVLGSECQTPTGFKLGSLSTNAACPDENLQPPLPTYGVPCGPAPFFCLPPGTPKLSITAYSAATAQCPLGQIDVQITSSVDPATVPGTPGPASVMCRTQIVVPANAYPGCGAATAEVNKPRLKPRDR